MIKEYKRAPLYNMLSFLIDKPMMFDIHSLRDLKNFIQAYEIGITSNGIHDADIEHFSKFDSFVNQKYKQMTTEGWHSIIEKKAGSRDFKDTLPLFEALLGEFKLQV